MLKPAQLYRDKLQEENIKSWYKPENIFWNGGSGDSQIDIQENNHDCHQFVSVDKDDNVIGYIGYCVDWSAMSADSFGIISFKKNSVEFAKDVYKVVCDLFEVYHMNRISWGAYTDNPAIRGYRNFVKKYGGRECSYFRQSAMLQDGKLHDSVNFEILAEEFKKSKSYRACSGTHFPAKTDVGISALEEIQKYRELGTVRQIEDFIADWRKYRELGNLDELREAMEKQKAKGPYMWGDGYADGKIVYDMYDCPRCGESYEIDGEKYDYCPNCGQAIDWRQEHHDKC